MTERAYPFDAIGVCQVAVVIALCCAIAGCGSGNQPGSAKVAPTTSNGTSGAAQPGNAAPMDACAMLSADDISALLSTPVQGQPTSTNPDSPGCKWENPSTYESVSLEIGNHGTAANNTLPPPEAGVDVGTPGPDGMRFLVSGQVEFAAGNRSNTVQVAVLQM